MSSSSDKQRTSLVVNRKTDGYDTHTGSMEYC